MARALRIRVDHNVCVGNAMCTTIAPKVFALNDDRQSEAVDAAGDTLEKILNALNIKMIFTSPVMEDDREKG